MGNGTDRVQKELKFKQLYKQYYAPFCLYAKRYVNDISLCEVKSVNRYKQKTLEILRSELKDYLPLLLLLIRLG